MTTKPMKKEEKAAMVNMASAFAEYAAVVIAMGIQKGLEARDNNLDTPFFDEKEEKEFDTASETLVDAVEKVGVQIN